MSRLTALFERLAIDVLAQCDVDGGARLLRLSWDEAWHLMDRAVPRGLAAKKQRVPARVGWMRRPPDAARTTSPSCPTWTPARWHIADKRGQASLEQRAGQPHPPRREDRL
jgi:hypothetical protein